MTHPDVTRYFMTIEEAVGLVLEAARLAEGRETFVLDMGQPVRIVDLVAQLRRPARRCQTVSIRFTGLRPGEKLHESLFSDDEICLPTESPAYLQVQLARRADRRTSGPDDQRPHEEAEAQSADEVRRTAARRAPRSTVPSPSAVAVRRPPYADDPLHPDDYWQEDAK